jgi:DNA-binding NarL/FixJ family response regulator
MRTGEKWSCGETTVPKEQDETTHSREVDEFSVQAMPASAHGPIEFGRICGGFPSRDVNGTIFVGVVDDHLFTRECITGFLREIDALEVISFTSCEDCVKSVRHADLFLYHVGWMKYQDNKEQRFLQLKDLVQIAPVIILSAVDCRDSIIEAFESGARGFIPTGSTTPKQVIEIIRFVNAGGTFVPPSSLSLQRANGSGLPPTAITTHQFTLRELAVLERLTLGKANKAIAYELQMSESTVKVHIKSIMNKLKATNRTEVVCRAFDLGGVGALSRHEA